MVYVFDMDGVLYRMDEAVPDAVEAIHRLQARGDAVFYLTNNSSRTREDYAEKLAAFGIQASPEDVMTSAYALGQWFVHHAAAGKRVYVIGESGLRSELEAVGMEIAAFAEEETVDYVVVGWDRSFTYARLAEAHRLVLRGARFIATNRDPSYPDAGGRTLPGSGALVAALETSTGAAPLVIGKPETYSLELILQRAGATPDSCLVIGDRLETDILIGKRAGAQTALVLTGVHTRADAELAPPEMQPDHIWETLAELP